MEILKLDSTTVDKLIAFEKRHNDPEYWSALDKGA